MESVASLKLLNWGVWLLTRQARPNPAIRRDSRSRAMLLTVTEALDDWRRLAMVRSCCSPPADACDGIRYGQSACFTPAGSTFSRYSSAVPRSWVLPVVKLPKAILSGCRGRTSDRRVNTWARL